MIQCICHCLQNVPWVSQAQVMCTRDSLPMKLTFRGPCQNAMEPNDAIQVQWKASCCVLDNDTASGTVIAPVSADLACMAESPTAIHPIHIMVFHTMVSSLI